MAITKRVIGSALVLGALLAGCKGDDQLVVDRGVGITRTLSTCPDVGIPAYTGDVTLFNPRDSRDASAIDIVANVSNLRSTCTEGPEKLYTEATFDITATRRDAGAARTVRLPYFSTVLRGGSAVISKRIGAVTLQFAEGETRASATGKAGAYVDRATATLPEDIQELITARRQDGDTSAAIDPLSRPEVQAAIQRATFEVLIGFQLTPDQLQYNATR
ncbi:hypothetical protein [Alterisphingorhabdus coralli]|uniref:Uncharacterized protein n=1 Tax=Alterisphingorhabdus coralli TaxID=3071408 RepID=A0AA97F623_9SPHN|nr:hypothetical protein [Parasphingorhabdus sp. SCSIO 66989]WOE74608.1 hypothetical protein RB602_12235 [Parasphingorhabdus sp. SCSIO 66989]